ncbi:unnamed protein product [Lactuca saligna]|uniref:Uncharacterized protein n=1 Tax=Lactuca saligna TaxID=75948 RepID=A0AA36DUX8_LACSI|nr:unnamed protein product [Lactuca saligna]
MDEIRKHKRNTHNTATFMVVCGDLEWVSLKCDSHRAEMAMHMREMAEERERWKRFTITKEGICTTTPTSALTPVFADKKQQQCSTHLVAQLIGRTTSRVVVFRWLAAPEVEGRYKGEA